VAKIIKLTKDKECIVDDLDYEWLSKYKWHYDGHTAARKDYKNKTNGRPKYIRMSRLLLGLENAPISIYADHINGNALDNTRANLRPATNQQNQANSKVPKNSTTGYKGVYQDKRSGKWISHIMFNHKCIILGRHSDIRNAVLEYNNAAIRYFGEYARINKIV
jgi:hypothetical protein